jgi:adenosine deaminase
MSFQASSSEDLDAGGPIHWFGSSGDGDDGRDARRLESFVQSIPKIELHVHLDGCFDPEELWQHLQRNPDLLHCFPVEKYLPWEDAKTKTTATKADNDNCPFAPPNPVRLREMVSTCRSSLDYRRLCTCRRRYRRLRHVEEQALQQTTTTETRSIRTKTKKKVQGSLEDMLLCFEFFFPLVYDNFQLLEHLAYDFVMRQREQNVIYTEVRYSPHLLANDPRMAHMAVTAGLRRGILHLEKGSEGSSCGGTSSSSHDGGSTAGAGDVPMTVNQILCAINFRPEWAADVVDMAHQYREDFPCAVVGVDVAAGEDHFDAESPYHDAHYDMCQRAIDLKINVTLHAGETPDSARNVPTAITEYGAKRIGHGYRISTDESIMDLARERNIHFEVCPTSSVETGGWIRTTDWRDHPACVFPKRGVKLSLSSDDPAVFNTSLTWQFRIVMKEMGWEEGDVLQSLRDAVDASFAPESEKERLRNQLQSATMQANPNFRDRVHYD